MAWGLAVDFGTTATAAAVRDADGAVSVLTMPDGASTMPSSVFADGGEITVGQAADHQAHYRLDSYEPTPKRRVGSDRVLLGDNEFRPAQLIGAVLAEVVREAVHQHDGQPPTELVLTHPVAWAETRRRVLREAVRTAAAGLELAGLPDPVLVPEPVAAAHWYARRHPPEVGKCLAVYDLGGGTFDATVLRRTDTGFDLVAEGGIDPCGGYDFDNELYTYLGQHQIKPVAPELWDRLSNSPVADPNVVSERQRLREIVRFLKEELSRHTSRTVRLPGRDEAVLVTRTEYEGLIRSHIADTVSEFTDILAASGVEAGEIDAVFRIGGAARTPLVTTFLDGLHYPLRTDEHPKLVVAQGAALLTAGAPAPVDEAQQWLDHAQAAHRRGDDGAAITGYQRVVALAHPDLTPQAHYELGELHRTRDDIPHAQAAYHAAAASAHPQWTALATAALAQITNPQPSAKRRRGPKALLPTKSRRAGTRDGEPAGDGAVVSAAPTAGGGRGSGDGQGGADVAEPRGTTKKRSRFRRRKAKHASKIGAAAAAGEEQSALAEALDAAGHTAEIAGQAPPPERAEQKTGSGADAGSGQPLAMLQETAPTKRRRGPKALLPNKLRRTRSGGEPARDGEAADAAPTAGGGRGSGDGQGGVDVAEPRQTGKGRSRFRRRKAKGAQQSSEVGVVGEERHGLAGAGNAAGHTAEIAGQASPPERAEQTSGPGADAGSDQPAATLHETAPTKRRRGPKALLPNKLRRTRSGAEAAGDSEAISATQTAGGGPDSRGDQSGVDLAARQETTKKRSRLRRRKTKRASKVGAAGAVGEEQSAPAEADDTAGHTAEIADQAPPERAEQTPQPDADAGTGQPVATLPKTAYASWFRRALAAVVDVIPPAIIVGVGVGILLGTKQTYCADYYEGSCYWYVHAFSGGGRVAVGVAAGLALLYVIWNWGYRQGRRGSTLGKALLKFEVIGEKNGQRIGFVRSVVRQVLHVIDAIALGIGLVLPLWDAKRQTLADKIMGTVCLRI